MNELSYLFLCCLLLTTALQGYLSLRQRRQVSMHRAAVPAAFAAKLSLKEHQRAADYTLAKGRLGRVELLLNAALLLVLTLGGGLEILDHFWRDQGLSPLFTGGAVLVSFMLLTSLLDIPTAVYRTFVLEARFGFNKSTPALFVLDGLKGMVLSLLLGMPLALLVLWLMQAAGSYWWVYAWAALAGFMLLLTWAYPTLIAPWFNQFRPLETGEVAARIDALLARTGFNNNGVFVMDGSRRSSHGNAYFTGFGNNKRIVFFDTLLTQLSPAQIEAVLAHELGHFKRNHVVKGLALSLSLMLAGLALLAWLMRESWFYTGLGISQPSTHMALILFLLVSPVFTLFITPLITWWSRQHEFEADAFAAEHASAAELIAALVNLYRENASTLTPDPLYSAFYDSHPPAALRIAHLQAPIQRVA